MSYPILFTFIFLGTFFGMEFVAWFTHKYIMHGLLWVLHEDHHHVDHKKKFQKNDFFFLIFAIPGILCILFGLRPETYFLLPIGLGITAYGAAYFFVHDIFIHQRVKFLRNSDTLYFRAIRKAHKVHHKHLNKEHGECFGMLLVPFKYFKEAKAMRMKQAKY